MIILITVAWLSDSGGPTLFTRHLLPVPVTHPRENGFVPMAPANIQISLVTRGPVQIRRGSLWVRQSPIVPAEEDKLSGPDDVGTTSNNVPLFCY